jgi:hypothetical protein
MTAQLIRLQAKEMAGVFYEDNQRSLRFRIENPDQDAYVAANWPHFVGRPLCSPVSART